MMINRLMTPQSRPRTVSASTTVRKRKRSKAKYYGIGEFKFNKPLFSCNSTGEEKVKQTEGSKCHADDGYKDDVTVEPAVTYI